MVAARSFGRGWSVRKDPQGRPSIPWLSASFGDDQAPVPASVLTEWGRYDRAGRRARIRHGLLEMSSLLVTAAIPTSAAFSADSRIIATLGGLALVANGARQLFAFKESWANRTKVRYAIEREVALFAVRAAPYADDAATRRLVETVAEICAAEREGWYTRRLSYDPNSVVGRTGSR
jgi:hypothetical protein